MSDTISRIVAEIDQEIERLQRARRALTGQDPEFGGMRTEPEGKPARRGRPRGGGGRRADVLNELRRLAPGGTLSIQELADRLGIKPNYLYRVVPQLVKEGLVKEARRAGATSKVYRYSGGDAPATLPRS